MLTATARRWSEPAVLLDVADGTLLHEAEAMEFRRIADDVYVATTSVTCRQYRRFGEAAALSIGSAGRSCAELDDTPVVSVTWFEAMAYSVWLGGTLPTEDEWARAAAAGRDLEFATATGELRHDLAYFRQPFGDGRPRPQSAYPGNPAGYLGMCGNTWDWCRSGGPSYRAIRGGSWMDSERFCRVGTRYRNAPVDRDCAVGFRVRIRARRKGRDAYVARRSRVPEVDRELARGRARGGDQPSHLRLDG
jgi:formylglycine-generating enzyme required for sulfatase activity